MPLLRCIKKRTSSGMGVSPDPSTGEPRVIPPPPGFSLTWNQE